MARNTGPSQAGVEIGVAVANAAFRLIVIAGSLRAGIGWGTPPSQCGYAGSAGLP